MHALIRPIPQITSSRLGRDPVPTCRARAHTFLRAEALSPARAEADPFWSEASWEHAADQELVAITQVMRLAVAQRL